MAQDGQGMSRETDFPSGWTEDELGLILTTMQNLPRPGNSLEPLIVERGEPGAPMRSPQELSESPLIGSFHWSDRDYRWRFVPAWRPGELDADAR